MWVIYNRHLRAWLGGGMTPTTDPSEAYTYSSKLYAELQLQTLNSVWRESYVLKKIRVVGYVARGGRSHKYYQFNRSYLQHVAVGEAVTVFSNTIELEDTSRHHQLITSPYEVVV
jgi:hypothetical protein